MPSFGVQELLIILAIVLILFGAKKLPDFARSLGKAKTEFRKGLDEGAEEESSDSQDAPEGADAEKTEP